MLVRSVKWCGNKWSWPNPKKCLWTYKCRNSVNRISLFPWRRNWHVVLLGRISDFKRLNKLYASCAVVREQVLETQVYVLTSQFLISRPPGEQCTVQAYRHGSRCYRLCVKWCALSAGRSEHATWITCPSIYSQHRHQHRVFNKYCFLSHRHHIVTTQIVLFLKCKSLHSCPWGKDCVMGWKT